MSYDFFNPTDLAFGQKLTAAFISLNNLANAAGSNLEDVYKNQEFYADYIGKNYPVSKPRKLGDPCRTDELYNLVNDHFMRITNLKKNDDGKLFIEAHLFNQRTNRMTHLTGTTDLEEGYIYYNEANSVIKPDKPFLFSEDEDGSLGTYFAHFTYDKNTGQVKFFGSVSNLGLIPYDWGSVDHLKWGKQVAGQNQEYTPTGYQCLCIKGNHNDIEVKVNGKRVFGGKGHNMVRHHIIYVNPSMVISGSYEWIREIIYY